MNETNNVKKEDKKNKETAKANLYVDDTSPRESRKTMLESETKTTKMLEKLVESMKASRMAVNTDKTQDIIAPLKGTWTNME
jgi:hypothetical protein